MKRTFEPQIVSVLKEGYGLKTFFLDLNAGLITGIIALPLAIAFAIASGVAPEKGLYTAIVAGFIISLLSGSRWQIGGPTGAFIVVVYNIIQQHGISGLSTATFLAGMILLLMGIFRLGSIIKYIPYPVTLGFTSGIALIIGVTQVRDFLGLTIEKVPAEFIPKAVALIRHLPTINWAAAIIGIASLLALWLLPKVMPRIPASIVVIILCTVITKIFSLPLETIGSRFGTIKGALPGLTFPEFDFSNISTLVPAAITIAMLGSIESLLSAVVADGMTGGRHRSNMELIAQGAANIASPLFGGIPATGAIARTAANIKNGGRTPFAGIIHAVVLLLILIVFGPYASAIPLAVLAAILMNVAFKMSESHLFIRMFRAPKSDIMVMLCTFLLTVLLDLTIAIPAGMVMASFLFMRRIEQFCDAKMLDNLDNNEDSDKAKDDESNDPFSLSRFNVPDSVKVFEINGPFFFGAAAKFQDAVSGHDPEILILRMRNVPAMDATGAFALEEVIRKRLKRHRLILLSGIHLQPLKVLRKTGITDLIGPDNIHRNIESALKRAEFLLNKAHSNSE